MPPKFDVDKDYYATLGLKPDASADDIRSAARKQRSQYHPDKYANAPAEMQKIAQEKSQAINEAYKVLGDGDTRKEYDNVREELRSRPMLPPPPQEPHLQGGPKDASRSIFPKGSGKAAVVIGIISGVAALGAYFWGTDEKAAEPPKYDMTPPGAKADYMNNLQLEMTSTKRRKELKDQLGLDETEAAKLQKAFIGQIDMKTYRKDFSDLKMPFNKIANGMEGGDHQAEIEGYEIGNGKKVDVHVDAKGVALTVHEDGKQDRKADFGYTPLTQERVRTLVKGPQP